MTATPDPLSPAGAWLRRVSALIAKAESTEFPAEAETLLAKAQELMTRHAIDEAMLEAAGWADRAGASAVESETIVVVPPYAGPKATLLAAVARANGCRTVSANHGDGAKRCVVVGHRSDLASTTTLFAALSMHATRAMLAAPVPAYETPRGFRYAFLLAFAGRISERLQEAARVARVEAEQVAGRSLLPVLADRSDAVDRAVAELFPHVRVVRSQARSTAGFVSGRAAADRADMGAARLPSRPGRLNRAG